jgi:hypothetical protein
MKCFPELYRAKIRTGEDFVSTFDLAEAIRDGCAAANRLPECKESLHD